VTMSRTLLKLRSPGIVLRARLAAAFARSARSAARGIRRQRQPPGFLAYRRRVPWRAGKRAPAGRRLYDGEPISMKRACFLAEQLRRLDAADIQVFIIRGNHDAHRDPWT
jgi:hypothetical protein